MPFLFEMGPCIPYECIPDKASAADIKDALMGSNVSEIDKIGCRPEKAAHDKCRLVILFDLLTALLQRFALHHRIC